MPRAILELERLLEAWGVLERGETGLDRATAGTRAEATGRSDRGRGADDAADRERAQPRAALGAFLVHATIVARSC
jgi:hypothetical protein